ncbi:hypothetical protein [Streptomyces sp. RS2]|uniref:hypothetical protein n=1 Tax=Streptomyces sp. RS2 TaxID=1451205 RepID=UPI0027E380F4|nr:hypothetical protein [Streptomyces sp. RS2]
MRGGGPNSPVGGATVPGGVSPAGSGRARSVNVGADSPPDRSRPLPGTAGSGTVGTLSRTGATGRRTRVCRSCHTGAAAGAGAATGAVTGVWAGTSSDAVGIGSAARWLEPSGSTRRGTE